jgi:hypothetical protein
MQYHDLKQCLKYILRHVAKNKGISYRIFALIGIADDRSVLGHLVVRSISAGGALDSKHSDCSVNQTGNLNSVRNIQKDY